MTAGEVFKVLVATDGSPAAQAALHTALRFPWPEPSGAQVLVAGRHARVTGGMDLLEEIWRQSAQREAEAARQLLASRWPGATLSMPDRLPIEAILSTARRGTAGAIVLGWRGHGSLERLLAGSVSRAVVRRSSCPVLIARNAPRSVQRIVLGHDGSAQSNRAIRLLTRMPPPAGNQMVLVSVVDMVRPLGVSWLPASMRARVKHESARRIAERLAKARESAGQAAHKLAARGWRVRTVVVDGAPLDVLLRACGDLGADVLVVGARAKRGLERLSLGSVALGALNRCRIPVLIVP